jgi:RNA polymerase sigma-70 factor (ECF subfamily)
VDDETTLLDRFEAERPRLRAVAYRMLGSASEADDAVQEAWLRLDRTDTSAVANLPAWLTTVVSRICLNLLRSRQTRREDSLESLTADWIGAVDEGRIPEDEAELADSVGLALLVVLDRLSPAERIAFVLHDMFDAGYDEIAAMMERDAAAVRQLASRARRKVRGTPDPADVDADAAGSSSAGSDPTVAGATGTTGAGATGASVTGAGVPGPDPARRRRAVDAYLAAARAGEFEALLVLLDPDVVLTVDGRAAAGTRPLTLQGALAVAKSAVAAWPRARHTAVALVDGAPALVMAPLGRLALVIRYGFTEAGIGAVDVVADPERLRALEITLG